MSAKDFDDDITEEVSEPEFEGRGVTLEDFVAYDAGASKHFHFHAVPSALARCKRERAAAASAAA